MPSLSRRSGKMFELVSVTYVFSISSRANVKPPARVQNRSTRKVPRASPYPRMSLLKLSPYGLM